MPGTPEEVFRRGLTAVGALVVLLVMRRPDVPGGAGRGEKKAGRG